MSLAGLRWFSSWGVLACRCIEVGVVDHLSCCKPVLSLLVCKTEPEAVVVPSWSLMLSTFWISSEDPSTGCVHRPFALQSTDPGPWWACYMCWEQLKMVCLQS